jgi:hypothetical protein
MRASHLIGGPLKQMTIFLQTATGAHVQVTGIVNIVIQIEEMQFIQQVVVASIQNDALLGTDFLSAAEAVIHCGQHELDIQGRRIPLGPESPLYETCTLIFVSTTTIEPGREGLLWATALHLHDTTYTAMLEANQDT